ncbi:MAG: putative toxin-antitoxin system toxin component, PIN family [Planctomycetes bacterium]|nr:putative toxin-antitoxin system toxin component, PIN family [Planctomycetota bacterium]
MRVVLDTNILARPSFSTSGPAAELLERLRSPEHELIASEFILTELDRVLRYPRLLRLHGFDDVTLARYVADVKALSVLVEVSAAEITPISQNDPDDDSVVATALAGNAEVLCTLDKHLHDSDVVAFCRQHGIRVLTDVELLRELR